MNKLMKALVLVSAAVSAIGALAYNGGYENSIDWRTNPAEGYGDYELTSTGPLSGTVGANAFAQCKRLTSVDLSNVTSIGDAAFAYSALESVTIPATVSSMGYIAFGGCTSLKSVTVSNFNWYEAGKEPFRECDALTTLVVGSEPPSWDIASVFENLTTILAPKDYVQLWRNAYPKFSIDVAPYKIYYQLDGGTPVGTLEYEGVGDNWYALQNPVRDGYEFAGWKVVDGLAASAVYSLDSVNILPWGVDDVVVPIYGYVAFSGLAAGGSVTLQAQWNAISASYSIGYDLGGGSFETAQPTEADRGGWYALSNPVRAGYEFAGWKIVAGLGASAVYSLDSVNILSWGASDVVVPVYGYVAFCGLAAGGSVTLQAQWKQIVANSFYVMAGETSTAVARLSCWSGAIEGGNGMFSFMLDGCESDGFGDGSLVAISAEGYILKRCALQPMKDGSVVLLGEDGELYIIVREGKDYVLRL